MKTIRVFVEEVSNCQRCSDNDEGVACNIAPFNQWRKVFEENQNAITPSCPRYAESFEAEKSK